MSGDACKHIIIELRPKNVYAKCHSYVYGENMFLEFVNVINQK